jgi:protein-disulfide isomerase
MIRNLHRNALFAAALLPLALGIAACKKDDAGTAGVASAAPLAKVPPPAGKAWSDVIATTPDGGYRMGNPNAPIKLVEYGSLTCPHCAAFAKESNDELVNNFVDSGRVSFEFRNFIRDPIDMTSAMLVRCAPPESFFGLTHATFANQAAMFDKVKAAGDKAYAQVTALPADKRLQGLAELTGLEDFFAANGLPRAQAQQCLANTAAASALARQNEVAQKDKGIDSTPTLFVNDQKLETPLWADTKARLEALGAR